MVLKTEFARDQPEDSTSTPENGPDCSEDEAYEVTAPTPKKSRKGSRKKVITVPIGDGDGSRSRGEVYPPPDSWSWRKYGQKPIKGSPYPRGYYRCSSSKGCPSRKQVERSCLDPTMLLITYTCEHNHPIPTSNKHHHSPPAAAATTRSATAVVKTEAPSTSTASTSSTSSDIVTVKEEVQEEAMVFGHQPDFDSDQSSGFRELASDMGWFSDVGSTMLDSQALVGPSWMDAYASGMQPIGEEDQSLFGDLGELPEYSMVFRRREVEGTTC